MSNSLLSNNPAQPHVPATPVLNIMLGSSAAAIAVMIHGCHGLPGCVPFRNLTIDRLDLGPLKERLESQFNMPRPVIDEALSDKRHFRPVTRFDKGTDFTQHDPVIRDCVHEPRLEEEARCDGQGSNGLPALGAVHLLANYLAFVEFLNNHINELLAYNESRMARRVETAPGLMVRIYATLRGGTATGAVLPVAAAARHLLRSRSNIRIEGVILLPPGDADKQARANAYAALQKISAVHSGNGGFPLPGGIIVPDPFDAVTIIDNTNGIQSFDAKTMLAQAAAQTRPLLDGPTQSGILGAIQVDLTGIHRRDHRQIATLFKRELMTRILDAPKEANSLEANAVLREAVTAKQERFNTFKDSTGRLDDAESRRVTRVIEELEADLNLTEQGLARRLEGDAVDSLTLVSDALDALDSERLVADPDEVKMLVPERLLDLREQLNARRGMWCENLDRLLDQLPGRMTREIERRLGDAPHLTVAAQRRLKENLGRLFNTCEAHNIEATAHRQTLAEGMSERVGQLAQAGGGVFGLIRGRQVISDCAERVITTGRDFFGCWIRQERGSLLCGSQVRETLVGALTAAESAYTRRVDAMSRDWREHLKGEIESLSCKVDWQAGPFDWAVMADRMSSATILNGARRLYLASEPIQAIIEQAYRGTLDQRGALSELKPLLPTARQIDSLEAAVLADPSLYNEVVARLKLLPPAPLDINVTNRIRPDGQARHTSKVLMLPSGSQGKLAQKLANDLAMMGGNVRVVATPGGKQEIALFLSEQGLPISAFSATVALRDGYDSHVGTGGISPSLFRGDAQLPKLSPPRTTVIEDATRAIVLQLALNLGKVKHRPYDRKFFLLSRQPAANRGPLDDKTFFIEREEEHGSFEIAVADLAKWPDILFWYEKDIEDALRRAYEDEPERQELINRLMDAYAASPFPDAGRLVIKRTLHDFRVDPDQQPRHVA